MTITLSEFLSQLSGNPLLVVTVILTLGVIMVNGWTDAPNAIATLCFDTRYESTCCDHYGGIFLTFLVCW